MKIGRNDKCPCGSGLKYKKCCLINSKSKQEQTEIDITNGFPNLKSKVKLLQPILTQYNFDDLVVAVFCINSWRDNRSVLESRLALNQVLLSHHINGKQTISCYSEFEHFYNEIHDILKPEYNDDLTIQDFGEVKLKFQNKVFPVILGTGHSDHVYSCYCYIEDYANTANKKYIFDEAFSYTKFMIDSLISSNNSIYEENKIVFDLPSNQYFDVVKEYVENYDYKILNGEFIELLSSNSIADTYFVEKNSHVYPLFNEAIIVSVYTLLLSSAEQKVMYESVQSTLYREVYEIYYNPTNNTIIQFCNAFIVKNKKVVSKKPYLIFGTNNNMACVFLFESNYSSSTLLKNEINMLHTYHKNGNFDIVEAESNRGITVPAERDLSIIVINNYTDISKSAIMYREFDDYFEISALDAHFMLTNCDSIEEICEFMHHIKTIKSQIFSMSGFSSFFLMWKESFKSLQQGAIEYSLYNLGYGSLDKYIYNRFKDELLDYPIRINNKLFRNFNSWVVTKGELGYNQYVKKNLSGLAGTGRKICENKFLFLGTFVYSFPNYNYETRKVIHLIEDLNQRLFNRHNDIFSSSELMDGKTLLLTFFNLQYIKSNSMFDDFDKTGYEYVYSRIRVDSEVINLQYTVNIDKLYKGIMESKDRRIECEYFKELLNPIKEYDKLLYSTLFTALYNEKTKQKEVDINVATIKHIYSNDTRLRWLNDEKLVAARKNIAYVCRKHNILPGEYQGQKATEIVRLIQDKLINDLIESLSSYSVTSLNTKLIDSCARYLLEFKLRKKGLRSFENITDDVKNEVENKLIDHKGALLNLYRSSMLLIDLNLCTNDDNGRKADDDAIDLIIAFSHWINVLIEYSNICYYGKLNAILSVESDYKINTLIPEEEERFHDVVSKRQAKYGGYSPKIDDNTNDHLKSIKCAFQKDTNVKYENFMDILDYLCISFEKNKAFKKVDNNVYSINEKQLKRIFIEEIQFAISKEELNELLEYITFYPNNIINNDGSIETSATLFDYSYNENRIELKPLTKYGTTYYFSPTLCSNLIETWVDSIGSFIMPYTVGLPTVKREIEIWKREYEKVIVDDVISLFENIKGLILNKNIWKDLEFYKLDRQDKTIPRDLGDFDVAAIDIENKTIWNIECKFIKLVRSAKEYSYQQDDFFHQKKYDEKFQKRIDYMNANYNKFLKAKKHDYTEQYNVKSYMVVNKVFVPIDKKINFEIITLKELEEMLS